MKWFYFLLPLLINISIVVSIQYAPTWTSQTIYNEAVVYIRFPQGSVIENWLSTLGTLLTRTFVLTTGRIFNPATEQLDLLVRVHSLLANAGGSIHNVDKRIRITPNYNFQDESFLHLMLLRLSTPVPMETSHMVARLAKPPIVPRYWHPNAFTRYVASGFQNRSYEDEFPNWNNEVMNRMSYQIREDPCYDSFEGPLDQYFHVGNQTGSYANCVCEPRPRNRECFDVKTLKYPGIWDDGTGLYVQKAQIMVGVAITRIPFKDSKSPAWRVPVQPYFQMIHHTRDKIVRNIHKETEDEFAGYIEFIGGTELFL